MSLIERLRAGARQFQFSGNEEEELAQAATEAADALEEVIEALCTIHSVSLWLKDPTIYGWDEAQRRVAEAMGRLQHLSGMPQFARATTQEEP